MNPYKLTIIENDEAKSILSTEAQAIKFPLSEDARHCIELLKEHHNNNPGVGLAANQINQPLQIILIEITEDQAVLRDNGSPYPQTIYINPNYEPTEDAKRYEDLEACFSVTSEAGWVPRYDKIHFTALNENGEAIDEIFEGFVARVLQHETDHVHGKLILDRFGPDSPRGTLKEMYLLRRELMSDEKRVILDALIKKQKLIE